MFWDFVDGGKEFSAVDTADLGLITQASCLVLAKYLCALCRGPVLKCMHLIPREPPLLTSANKAFHTVQCSFEVVRRLGGLFSLWEGRVHTGSDSARLAPPETSWSGVELLHEGI